MTKRHKPVWVELKEMAVSDMRLNGYTQGQYAKLLGMTQGALSLWLGPKGDALNGPHAHKLVKRLRKQGYMVPTLKTGKG